MRARPATARSSLSPSPRAPLSPKRSNRYCAGGSRPYPLPPAPPLPRIVTTVTLWEVLLLDLFAVFRIASASGGGRVPPRLWRSETGTASRPPSLRLCGRILSTCVLYVSRLRQVRAPVPRSCLALKRHCGRALLFAAIADVVHLDHLGRL